MEDIDSGYFTMIGVWEICREVIRIRLKIYVVKMVLSVWDGYINGLYVSESLRLKVILIIIL